ncbi:dimethylmenaquinone methyltransferase [uncultured Enterovirga sp.]|uniref:dimethylmenaquinone methyltransferase n=1 Tax=uncultured Enterovirga sp. TaxID=2026352 RepID=UPI0035CA672C
MNVTQITHHDLDGYGAATVVGAYVEVGRIVHVPRYADVGPVVDEELKRLGKTAESEMLILTDLGLEDVAVKFIQSFAALNRRRDEGVRHRLVVLDHHVSSVDRLREHHALPASEEGSLRTFAFDDPGTVVLIDGSRCATRMAYENRALYAARDPSPEVQGQIETLVASIDAVDLWQKTLPTFIGGLALDEVFWDNVSNLVPIGHPWHDRFVGALLLGVARLLQQGLPPARIEREVGALRTEILDAFLSDDPGDDRSLTTRMRIAPVLARSRELFRPLSDGTLLSFGLDAGTFQRVSDAIMDAGGATRVVNVQRTGSLSFRSTNETALDGARKFRGGGHKDAAGGKLPNGSAFSLADACAQVEPILNPPPPDLSKNPFGALKNWKG